jgi:hypothetical protein
MFSMSWIVFAFFEQIGKSGILPSSFCVTKLQNACGAGAGPFHELEFTCGVLIKSGGTDL